MEIEIRDFNFQIGIKSVEVRIIELTLIPYVERVVMLTIWDQLFEKIRGGIMQKRIVILVPTIGIEVLVDKIAVHYVNEDLIFSITNIINFLVEKQELIDNFAVVVREHYYVIFIDLLEKVEVVFHFDLYQITHEKVSWEEEVVLVVLDLHGVSPLFDA